MLTVRQPWASAVFRAGKDIENRVWPTNYRGRLWIHAGLFGGTFAVKNAATSNAILADKTARILETRADVCCALDNSCLLQIGGALSRHGSRTRTAHVAEILAAGGAA